MDLTTIKDTLYIVAVAFSAVFAMYKIAKNLNVTLLNLNYEIKRLNDTQVASNHESKQDRLALHKKTDKLHGRVDVHENRITILETKSRKDW